MPVVSVTRLRVRAWRYLPGFALRTFRIAFQAKRAEGNLGVRLLADRRNTFWTSTLWRDEASMRAFMLTPPHGPAMRKLLNWCDEASLVHWSQPGDALPTWTEAHRLLLEQGRASKVYHPSSVHSSHAIPEPRTSRQVRVR